jgi:anti-sigma factor ChrR (cupin superfamily)
MGPHRERLRLDPRAGGAAFGDDDREPQIHADFSRPLAVQTGRMEWQPSPASGVWRKRLELIGHAQPRLTSTVRFEPGSRFDQHGHPGGEEILVLSGTFSDASGDFPAGSYLRNPRGWVHAPWTETGCELFVKLCQFQPDDHQRVIIQPGNLAWQASDHRDLSLIPLHTHGDEQVTLERLAPGAQEIALQYPSGAEILLLEGELEADGQRFPLGTWLRLPAGTSQVIGSGPDGCRFYCKRGSPVQIDSG